MAINLTDVELEQLERVQSLYEWTSLCDRIKAEHNGQYPDDWYHKVVSSGLASRVSARWGGDAEVHVSAI